MTTTTSRPAILSARVEGRTQTIVVQQGCGHTETHLIPLVGSKGMGKQEIKDELLRPQCRRCAQEGRA